MLTLCFMTDSVITHLQHTRKRCLTLPTTPAAFIQDGDCIILGRTAKACSDVYFQSIKAATCLSDSSCMMRVISFFVIQLTSSYSSLFYTQPHTVVQIDVISHILEHQPPKSTQMSTWCCSILDSSRHLSLSLQPKSSLFCFHSLRVVSSCQWSFSLLSSWVGQ